jgi:hypothetical protein
MLISRLYELEADPPVAAGPGAPNYRVEPARPGREPTAADPPRPLSLPLPRARIRRPTATSSTPDRDHQDRGRTSRSSGDARNVTPQMGGTTPAALIRTAQPNVLNLASSSAVTEFLRRPQSGCSRGPEPPTFVHLRSSFRVLV